MMQGHRVVVFDLDDTLYKEIDFLKYAYRHIASLVANANIAKEDVYALMWEVYRRGGDAFGTVVQKYKLKLFDVSWMLSVYRNIKPKISMDDDTISTLEWLKARNVPIGIISDGRKAQQMEKIQSLGIREFVKDDDIIINDVTERMKPDSRSFIYFMRKYGENCRFCYVGDNTFKDFIAPNSLGWKTFCLVDDGRNIHKQNFHVESGKVKPIKIYKISDILRNIEE